MHFYVCTDFVAKMEDIESQAIVTGYSFLLIKDMKNSWYEQYMWSISV